MNKKYIEFVATFLILLVLNLPFYTTSVYATINSVSVKGISKIEGFAKPQDSLDFDIGVSIQGDNSISIDQVMLGSSTPFTKCQKAPSNQSECTLKYTNTFEPKPLAYTINIFKDDGTKDSSYSGYVIIDGLSPTVTLQFSGNAFSSSNPIKANIGAEDRSCNDPACSSKCVGVDKIEVSVVNGTFKKIIDFANGTNSCLVNTNFTVDASALASGPVTFSVVATDIFGQSSSPITGTITIDKTPPTILAASFLILRETTQITAIGPRDLPVDVFVNISAPDLDTSSVIADLSPLNPNANYGAIKPNECIQLGNIARCRWSITMNSGTAIPEDTTAEDPSSENAITANVAVSTGSPKGSIVINASDISGNKASAIISKTLPVDAKGPVVVSILTKNSLDGKFYAKQFDNTITANFKEDTGMLSSDVKLSADGATYTASRCKKSGDWICIFENVVLSKGTLSITSTTTDILLNPVKDEKTLEVIVDDLQPLLKGISLKSINNLENPDLFKVGDKIYIEANVTEKNQLTAVADLSKFINKATKVQGSCAKIQNDDQLCTWTTDPIDFQASDSITFNFSDPAGNFGIFQEFLTTLGLDEAAPANYWDSQIECSPKLLDRQLGPFINQRMYCSINLIPKKIGATTVSISPVKCGSNSLLQLVETINREPGSRNPVMKLTFKKDTFNIDQFKLDCSIEIFTRFDNKITKNPEIETANITVKFYNQPLGELSEEVERKIQEAKDDAQGIWKLVGTLNKFVTYAKRICQLLNTAYTIVAAFYTLTAILKGAGPASFGTVEPAAQATCFTTEELSNGADLQKKGFNKFCDFVTCKQTLWGSDIEKWMNSLPGADYLGESEDGKNIQQDYVTGRKINLGPNARPLSTYMDPQNSLAVAMLYGCLPGIIHGLDKYRQIKCLYADCLINSVGKDGLPLKVCEDQKKYATCKYVTGEIFAVIPYTAMFDHFMGLIKDTLSNPFKLIGVGVSLICQQACKVPDGGFSYTFCRGARLLTLVGDAAENVRNIMDTGFKIRDDYCSRLDFDEEEPKDTEEPETTTTKK